MNGPWAVRAGTLTRPYDVAYLLSLVPCPQTNYSPLYKGGAGGTSFYKKLRKRVMMPVLMKSTNIAPMMGTMRKGLTV